MTQTTSAYAVPTGHTLYLGRYTDHKPTLHVLAGEGANVEHALNGAGLTPNDFEMKALTNYNGVENDNWIAQIRPTGDPVMEL